MVTSFISFYPGTSLWNGSSFLPGFPFCTGAGPVVHRPKCSVHTLVQGWKWEHPGNSYRTLYHSQWCIQCRPRLHLLTAELAREVWYKGKNAFRMWMCLGCLWNFFLLSARGYLCWLLSPLSLYCRRILISSIWKDLGSCNIMISLSLHYLLALFFYFSILVLFAAALNSLRWTPLTEDTISNCSLGIQCGTSWRYFTKNSQNMTNLMRFLYY